ncbi:outer membrane protein OmpA-like peptidoglycan-associated protein [Variovorax boronicumulans]|uniref:Outer membrane protein OmpA-like peptidoglycan-associated protein n=1 Tax=Variovorax boronicumulans TaxID=436515 RepID=A0AAW8DVF3_9BURK|nr:OmpA family protein [Variovorax boronicumulans]MDP9878360.1 outer membrane protein OmpA-like peptidoglycan-associated protein [Variovorax boronicumulans]MDP9916141.1 outer membrane protein OmpA-like peptidoglycan-associated protein [Variovorax boronicumulans]MDP9923636.1 outer membrane protein OmpA-like peptidoglycan-associated protein [Variovorax boronicumulans]
MNRTLSAVALAALLAALQGCASPGAAIDKDAQARAAAEKPAAPRAEEFPALDSAKWKQGAFPGTEKFQRVRPGMGKDQLRELLGWPHFSEGLWGVREWNYIFHFYTGKGSEHVTCQYMVRFNGSELMTGGWWKNPDCALLAQPPAATPIPASTKLAPPQKVTLNADGLFRFDGASLTDLQPAGRTRLEHLAVELRNNFRSLHYIVVTGHTDRLGGDAYNEALSLERANTVRDLLVQQGLDRKLIRTAGMGKRQPVVSDCEGSRSTPTLLQCLQPNRRVELDIAGEQ